MQITFPEIRSTFIPDPDHIIFDIDLEGADAQVVAWTADDEDLKAAFRSRIKVHAKNAIDIHGKEVAGEDGKREPTYTRTKRAIHATHYGASINALMIKCKMSRGEAEYFYRRWLYELHPKIREWMERVEFDLQRTGSVTNRFGYACNFYQRGSDAYTNALSWEPQSTVARICEIAMVRIARELPDVQLLLQVHDSLVFQIHRRLVVRTLPRLDKLLQEIEVPFPDPLIIPWGIKASRVSWGECKTIKWSDYAAVEESSSLPAAM